MAIKILLSGDGLDDERIDKLTRELLTDIRADVDPAASLPKAAGGIGAKGADVLIGVILAAINMGVVGKLVVALSSYLNRNRKISFDVQKPDGSKLKLSYEYVRGKQADEITAAVTDFLKK